MRNLFEDAIQYGKKEGKMEGRIEGKIEGKIEAITDILSIRFPDTDLNDITYHLQHIDDIEFLDYLKNQAKTVPSIEEFKRLLEKI